MGDYRNRGPVYTATFTTTAASTGGEIDAFGLTAPSNSRVEVHAVSIGQPTANPPAANLGVLLLRGSTAIGGGTTITPRNLAGWTGALTAGSSVTGPSTSVGSTASAVVVYADAFVGGVWWYYPAKDDRVVLEAGQRLNIRLTTPQQTSINGTIMFSETGRGLPS